MAYASSRHPDGWQVISDQFNEFGYIDFHCRISSPPTARWIRDDATQALSEWTLRIMLQPLNLPRNSTDAEVRGAMYELAEDAIAIAKENYVLLSWPEIRLSGGGNNSYLQGELILEFRMRREGE